MHKVNEEKTDKKNKQKTGSRTNNNMDKNLQ